MTISTTESNQGFVGDGVTVTFAVTYVVLDADHIKPFIDNVEQNTGFTVTLNPDQETTPGADVTFDVAPANGVSVNLLRVVPLTQETDYQPFDAFPAESHETALDKLTLITQQNAEALGRVPQLPVDTPLDGYDLGTPVPNEVIQYKSDGTGQESSGIDATQFNANVQAAADSAAAALASENKANQWAENPEDVEVDPGQFSAFHWAMKSQAFTDWDQYLDGYDPTSNRHERYMGTLDAILINSKYFIDSTEIIAGPADFVGLGIIETNMWDTDTNQAVQLLVSMDVANNGAAWIREREGGTWGAWSPFGAGGTTVTDTAPSSPSVGDGWWDPDTGKTYIWYDDGSSQQWVEQDPDTSLLAGAPLEVFVNGEPVAASGDDIEVVIPPGVKRIHFVVHQLTTDTTNIPVLQMEDQATHYTSGYLGSVADVNGSGSNAGSGFLIANSWLPTRPTACTWDLTLIDESNNTWVCKAMSGISTTGLISVYAGSRGMSSRLTKLHLVVGGGAVFTGGVINVQYENPAAQANLSGAQGQHTMGFYDGNGGGASQSPTTVVAQWYKVGRLVHLTVPNTGPISTAGMTGVNRFYFDLPFIPSHIAVGSVMVASVNYGGLATSWVAYVEGGADRGYFKVSQEQVSEIDMQVQNFGGNGEIVSMTIVYTTDE